MASSDSSFSDASPSSNGAPSAGSAPAGAGEPTISGTGRAARSALPSRWRRILPPALIVLDVVILLVAFIGALKARYGAWTLPGEVGVTGPLLVTLAVYPAALALTGLYRTPLRGMHLPQFLRAGAALLGAWAVSVALTYLTDRHGIPSRSVSALQCLLAMIGILGLRALLRYELDKRNAPANDGARPPSPPDEPGDVLQLDDLLPHEDPVEVDTAGLRDYLTGRTVLVTGAGGSIGTELVEQLLELQPFRLVLVDISEYNLFRLENALRSEPFDGEIEFCIADVRDREIMEGLFSDFRPDVILHAAAYKHVPLMERHPAEAFRNNTLTTVRLLELSCAYDTEQFVFVSTDKAVEPKSVLGATKRLAEWYVRSQERAEENGPECKIVRFGNVFGSQGSVAPLFEKQLREGGPARVTHPAMERYFMTPHEACSLILQTLLLESAPVYVFDMGEPVSIQRLAEEAVRRLRPGAAPADHIVHTGIRPGEKLREKLQAAREERHPTAHSHVYGLEAPVPHRRAALTEHFRRLKQLCRDRRGAALRRALFAEDLPAEDAPAEEVPDENRPGGIPEENGAARSRSPEASRSSS